MPRNGDSTPDKRPSVETAFFYGCLTAFLILGALLLLGWITLVWWVRR